MKNKKAFTLIELLVVVLIIGILAAIAVPQYQTAVDRSNFIQLKTLAEAIIDAQDVYFLANGKYATSFNNLDITMPAGKLKSSAASKYIYDWGTCYLAEQSQCVCYNSNFQYQIEYVSKKRKCISFDARGEKLCKLETKDTKPGNGGSYKAWFYK